jgi:lipopolysaccharide exporter
MFCSAMATVLFPIFASLQDDLESLRRGFLLTTQYMFLVVAPIGIGLALVAEPFIIIFLSDRWLEAIPVIRAVAIFSTVQAIPYSAGIVYKARARQNILTLITIVQFFLVAPTIYWVTVTYGSIVYVAWMQVVNASLIALLSLAVAVRIINASMTDIFKALVPGAASGLVMTVCVLGSQYLIGANQPVVQLMSSTIVGAVSYTGSLYLLNREIFFQMLRFVKLRRTGT